ncbi:MATE family efflux transporter [candidate division NPL-UPA2 bacterium]|nr:MATE family efflux transporter [candidate division NPL-UPA2 bacterium]
MSEPVLAKLRKRELSQGSIVRNVWALATPMMLGNILQTTFNIVDMLWVGRLGEAAIAAVAMSGSILMVIMTLIIGIATGTIALVARFTGAGNRRKANEIAMQSLILSFIASSLLAAAGFGLAEGMLKLLGGTPEVVALGSGYLKILLVGGTVMFLLFLTEAILRGAGDARTPFFILIISTLLNAVLNPLMIFGIGFPRLGVNGAALATVLARGVGVVIAFRVLFRGSSPIHLEWKNLKVDFGLIWRIIRLGVPSSIQMSLRGLMGVILMAIVAKYGTYAVAAYGVGLRIMMLVLMPAFGLATAAATLVGQNLGAGKPERAHLSAWTATRFNMLIMGTVGTAFFLFAPHLISFFNTNPQVVEIGTAYLRITSLGYLFIALGVVLGRALNGAGDTVSPLVITFLSLWCLQIPLALILPGSFHLGVSGVWWATLISTVIHGAITTGWFQQGRWKLKKI